jgi:hypothetical protein
MKNRYMNPYVAGTLLGLVLLLAMFLSGRGLGASGGIKYCIVRSSERSTKIMLNNRHITANISRMAGNLCKTG